MGMTTEAWKGIYAVVMQDRPADYDLDEGLQEERSWE